MTQKQKDIIFYEKYNVVETYVMYLKGEIKEFPYSKRLFKKSLQSIMLAAMKQQKYREYLQFRKIRIK